MKKPFGSRLVLQRKAGFSRLDLLGVVSFGILLAGYLIPALARPRRSVSPVQCLNNLKNIGLSCRIFAVDHGDKFPWQLGEDRTNSPAKVGKAMHHFLSMTNELSTTKILVCPVDKRKPAESWENLTHEHLSYFVGISADHTQTNLLLSGDRNITNGLALRQGALPLAPSRSAGWTHEMHHLQGFAVMADGSAQRLNNSGLNRFLRANPSQTNRILLPE